MNVHKLAAVLLVPVLFFLTACEGDSPTEASGTDSHTRAYRGSTVTCYDVGAGKGRMGTCDFNSFYEANPALLSDSTEGEEEGVRWVKMNNGVLACVQIGSGTTRFMGCDWLRFDANHTALR